jgi:hypothetical protein
VHHPPQIDSKSVLAIPHHHDTIDQLSIKLIAIAKVTSAGESIAVATAFLATPAQERIATEAAISQMTPWEKEAWATFTGGTWRLPDFDWDNSVAPAPPASSKSLKIARRRAEALTQLYQPTEHMKGILYG